jgi:hypothetical protein
MSTIAISKPLTYLPLKYAKYAHYLYWVLQKVRNSEDTPEFTSAFNIISKKLYEETMMFSHDFPEQNAFYDLFISQEKDAAKAINDAKPKKKRTRKAKPVEGTSVDGVPETEEKKEKQEKKEKKEKVVKEKAPPKEKKEKVIKEKDSLETNSNNDIIAQIVSRANSIESDIEVEVVDKKESEELEKKAKKEIERKEKKEREELERKEKKHDNGKKINEITEELVLDFVNDIVPPSEEEEDDDEEVELTVTKTTIDGTEYFKDSDGNLYSTIDMSPIQL